MRRVAVDTKPPGDVVGRRRQRRLPLHVWRILVPKTTPLRPSRTRAVPVLTRLVVSPAVCLVVPGRAASSLVTQRPGTRQRPSSAAAAHPPEKAVWTDVVLQPPVRPRSVSALPKQKDAARRRAALSETERVAR